MKKIMAILIMGLLLVSILPLAFADEVNVNADASASVNANNNNILDKTLGNRVDIKVRKELRQENKDIMKEAREKIKENKLQLKEDVKQKIEIRQENRKDMKIKMDDAREALKNSKEGIQKSKIDLRQCKDKSSEECKNIRKLVVQNTKQYMEQIVEKLAIYLDRTKMKVQESKLDETRKQETLDRIASNQKLVVEVKVKVEALSDTATKDEAKEVTTSLKETWKEVQATMKYVNSLLVEKRIGNVIEKVNHLDIRLESVIAKLKQKGIDTTQIQIKVDEFNKHIITAKLKRDEALKLFETAKASPGFETSSIMLKANQLLKESHEELKQAHEILKEIVKLVKEQQAGKKILEETNDNKIEADATLQANTIVNASI